jgi:hypothetical protein
MYRTVPPIPGRARRGPSLRLTHLVRREFAAGGHPGANPALDRYYADLAALHGVEGRPDLLAAGAGNTFADMARAVLADVVAAGRPVDLVLVAHTLPDLDPWLSVGVSLTRIVPGAPLAFAVSGADGSVAFIALRLAGDYARRHGYRRVVVLVIDQGTLPYRHDAPPAGDAAVALLLEDAPGREVTLGRLADPSPGPANRLFGRDAHVVDVDVDGRYPGTGAWSAVRPDGGSRVVLVARDPARAELRYCAVDGGTA